MARAKRSSKILEQAESRSSGLKAIDPALDLGGGLTIVGFDADIADLRDKLNDYNQTLASLDEKLNEILAAEKIVSEKAGRMLAGVAARHGKDSNQYELAGGVRTSERKARTNKATKG